MKKSILVLLAVVLFAGTWATNALAVGGLDKLSVDLEVDYASRYIWRGIDLIPDNQPAVQPWLNLGYAVTDKLTVNYLLWADYRLVSGADPADRGGETDNDWDEFDHVGYLTYDLNDTYSFELGYILYYLPSLTNTQEVYGGVTMALPYDLSTSLYVYYDFDSDTPDGIYAKWAVEGTRKITEYADFVASAGLGYMNYEDEFEDGLADLPLSAGISVDLGHGLSTFVSVNYSFTLDALRDNGLNNKNEGWVMTGLALSL